MYSLVIAEDELTTRRGFVNMMKWDQLGFQVDGEFSDGQELLDYLKNNMPDVILTDIKMSRVSGLEIARFVSEQNLPVQIVFLSGYKNFEYAQSAIEYGVLHYLVKPVSIPKIREVFMSLREKLDKQSALQRAMLNRRDHYQKLVNYQKQQFIMDAWSGALHDKKQVEERLSLVDINANTSQKLCLFLVKLTMQNDSLYTEFISNYGLQELQEQLTSILESIDQCLEYYPIKWENSRTGNVASGLGVFWGKGDSVSDRNTLISMWQVKERVQKEIYNLTSISAELTILKEMKSPIELIFCKEDLGATETVEGRNSTGIENVMSYCREHFCEDITLADVGDAVFLNPIYISRLIKEQTGRNYTDLIMEMRIEKAVELLKETNLYVYEIAERVGYHNLKYFYKVFKKVKGNSPNDYRPKQKR